jgi:glucokinase-like ROK family protein
MKPLSIFDRSDRSLVRKVNTSQVLDCLRTSAPLSRSTIAHRTGLNRSTVSSVVDELLVDNLVREVGLQPSQGGRPGVLLELNPQGGCAVGVELGIGFFSVLLSNFAAEALWRKRVSYDPTEDFSATLMYIEELIQHALDVGQQMALRPLGVGLGLPGLVDIRTGELVLAPNLKVESIQFGKLWQEKFGVHVFLENEANAAALGEFYFGHGRNVRNLIYLSAGVGVGSGIVINGRLFRGTTGFAGEIGHMATNSNSGEMCGCGKRGCFETFVGPRSILRRVRRELEESGCCADSPLRTVSPDEITMEMVVDAAQKDNSIALSALQEAGQYLGVGISNLVNIFNPEMVVLGGALNIASPILLPIITQTTEEQVLPPLRDTFRIVASAHGVDACVMGAVALVMDDILREPMANLV